MQMHIIAFVVPNVFPLPILLSPSDLVLIFQWPWLGVSIVRVVFWVRLVVGRCTVNYTV